MVSGIRSELFWGFFSGGGGGIINGHGDCIQIWGTTIIIESIFESVKRQNVILISRG